MLRLRGFVAGGCARSRRCSNAAAGAAQPAATVGSSRLDWANLGFDFRPTNGFVHFRWRNGKWDLGTFERDQYLKVHVMSSAVHYGQGLFEGAKAHHCKDGSVRLWNLGENAARMQQGARRMLIPPIPTEMFVKACDWAVRENLSFLPPYGTGGSMYLRPFLFGHGPQLGLQPAPEYSFCVLAIPVGSYYKGGLKPIDVLALERYDRAAPKGVGNVKASGNYGSDILPSIEARAQGFPTVLYLDAAQHRYVEEFSVSNFIGIRGDRYVTPKSDSILFSTTNKMLMRLAPRMGMQVEHRPVPVDELPRFDEVAGCGTAVVLMGVRSITHRQKKIEYARHSVTESMYALYRAIQFGEEEDQFGWGVPLRSDQPGITVRMKSEFAKLPPPVPVSAAPEPPQHDRRPQRKKRVSAAARKRAVLKLLERYRRRVTASSGGTQKVSVNGA